MFGGENCSPKSIWNSPKATATASSAQTAPGKTTFLKLLTKEIETTSEKSGSSRAAVCRSCPRTSTRSTAITVLETVLDGTQAARRRHHREEQTL
ncbi:MAG: hypothetical protein MZU79_01600 [Anaerotruncus sp.]|nr:hypothetical protein [Anaerotruncus sp.]